MMKCPKCNRNLVGDKNAKAKDGAMSYVGDAALMIFGGPILTTLGALSTGAKMYDRFVKDEVEVKCPHCKAKITLTRKQYKQLKNEISEAETKARHAKQNRIKD